MTELSECVLQIVDKVIHTFILAKLKRPKGDLTKYTIHRYGVNNTQKTAPMGQFSVLCLILCYLTSYDTFTRAVIVFSPVGSSGAIAF